MEKSEYELRKFFSSPMPMSNPYVTQSGPPIGPKFSTFIPVPEIEDPTLKDVVEPAEATKYDAGKTQWHLFPWDAAEEIIKVLQFGAGKYSPWNWAEADGFKYSRLFNSSMRHFIAWFWRKEDNDPETGISHLAHLGCNVVFLLHYVLNKGKFKTNDDRR